MLSSSVVVDDLDVVGITVTPHEAEPKLSIDADRMLTEATALERFEAVAGSKICEQHCGMQTHDRTSGGVPKAVEGGHTLTFDKPQGPFVTAAADHVFSVVRRTYNVQRKRFDCSSTTPDEELDELVARTLPAYCPGLEHDCLRRWRFGA
jgi:hypothetical protein